MCLCCWCRPRLYPLYVLLGVLRAWLMRGAPALGYLCLPSWFLGDRVWACQHTEHSCSCRLCGNEPASTGM